MCDGGFGCLDLVLYGIRGLTEQHFEPSRPMRAKPHGTWTNESGEDCLQDISGGTEGDGRRQERLHCDPALPGLGLRADHHQDLLGQEPLHTGQEQGEHEHHLVQTDLSVKGPYRVAPPAL